MKRIVVASNNQHKIKEIKHILEELSFDVISLKEAGIDVDVEENGTTFMENAYIKASEIHKLHQGDLILADDSGLMVDAIGGAPGVYSARFAGEHGNDRKNNEKLLDMLKGKAMEERTARFVCALVLITEDERIIKVQGEIEGYIKEELNGLGGFGYDPLFFVPEYKMTFGEMTEEMKNSISHRSRALSKLKEELQKII